MILRFDAERSERIGMPEAVLCAGKSTDQIQAILRELAARPEQPVLFTRLDAEHYASLPMELAALLHYDPLSRTGFLHGVGSPRPGAVALVCAGTSDLAVVAEAARTLEFLGVSHETFADVGVAGIHRLFAVLDDILRADLVIAVAGMDAALASVLGGLVRQPIIGVPTSTGYGAAHEGQTALNAMLSTCAQGVVVTNIDNGFGAACAAARMLNAQVRS